MILLNFKIIFIVFHILILHSVKCIDLFGMNNKNIVDSVERISREGFGSEKYSVRTEDGYLLTLFRILSNQRRNATDSRFPVLLQHCLLGSSDVYLVDSTGLGFELAREGYDVWISNSRGNGYSRNHVRLSPDTSEEFWNFSWHEMGMYDTPAVIDFILERTRRKQLHYIGHSMGTTMFYVMTSSKPDYNRKIRTMISMAPVARMTKWHNFSFTNSTMYNMLTGELDGMTNRAKWELFPRVDYEGRSEHQSTCAELSLSVSPFCYMVIGVVRRGVDSGFPAGTSVRTNRHYMQIIGAGKFNRFDYGDENKNRMAWGSPTPTEYDFKRVTAPVAIFYTPSDELVAPEDAEYMISTLPNVIKVWKAPDFGFSHMDFAFSTNLLSVQPRKEMSEEIIKLLNDRN